MRNVTPKVERLAPGFALKGLSPGAGTGNTKRAEVMLERPIPVRRTPREMPRRVGVSSHSPVYAAVPRLSRTMIGTAKLATARARPARSARPLTPVEMWVAKAVLS